jgi:hypothetical protein
MEGSLPGSLYQASFSLKSHFLCLLPLGRLICIWENNNKKDPNDKSGRVYTGVIRLRTETSGGERGNIPWRSIKDGEILEC